MGGETDRLALRSANMFSSTSTSAGLNWGVIALEALARRAPPSKDLPLDTSCRSMTRKDGCSAGAERAGVSSSATDFRLEKATENLGI